MTILLAENISKVFYKYPHEAQRFASWFGLPCSNKEPTWVLKNINLRLDAGQTLGIVGKNGAGKSTLLKIITGTTAPTGGRITINGQLASILELGMGFNRDLTGKQNALYTGAMLGFSAKQMKKAMSDIVAFAELESCFNQTLRTYSSGMELRLAFAVTTAVRPDLLIIDEAITVGDIHFQQKCFSKIMNFKRQGTAILMVSHLQESLLNFCDKIALLEHGKIADNDSPLNILKQYQQKSTAASMELTT